MADRRRDPDALLREVQATERDRRRGRLKVFLGASAGVGKTYAMLAEAHELRRRGGDIAIGFVETHGRRETTALLEGLEVLPRRRIVYRGVELEEFDLDAALLRKPDLLVVDELAHANVPGSRHLKRWQDIEELLAAGIDVHTAVNVQHLESLNDSIAQITGVVVKETVPDSVIEGADEIEVVDIPPEELRQRLREGKVYVPERIDHALEGFFKPANLLALRELALRRAADRVDRQMRALREGNDSEPVWPARDRIVACLAPSAMATRIVRTAARIAAASHADWLAVYVESDRQVRRPPSQHGEAHQALRLAERMGVATTTLAANDIAGEILAFARRENATLIVMGKPIRARWREVLSGSVVEEVIRRSGEIDVHVVTEEVEAPPPHTQRVPLQTSPKRVLATVLAVAGSAGVGYGLDIAGAGDANLVMVLLIAVALVARYLGPAETLLATVLSVLAFNFLFVDPRYTLAVSDTQYLLTFAIMLGVAMLISTLTLRLKATADASADRERRSAALYALSRELAKSRSREEIAKAAQREVEATFGGEAAVFMRYDSGVVVVAAAKSGFHTDPNELAVASWAAMHGHPAGRDTDTLGGAGGLYLPLLSGQGPIGVLAFRPEEVRWPLTPTQRGLLETFANTLGLALERAKLAKESHEARVSAESEKLRNALLSSISHDLRTPLTSISGAASALVAQGGGELAETIYEESVRMNHQVQNLLDMTRLQSGQISLRLEWHVLSELVGDAIGRCRDHLRGKRLVVTIPETLPLLRLDGELLVKLFTNLLENTVQHAATATEVRITALDQTNIVRVIVADNGPGILKGEESAVFERFVRGGEPGKGLGLGLAICRTIAKLHGARIWVRNGREGGAEFHLELPRPEEQPEVPVG